MKKRFFTISIGVVVPLLVILMIGSKVLFTSPNTIIEDYRMHEKQLGTLFEKFEEESETMTDEELTTWENQVKELSSKAASVLVEIQKDPEHWEAYLASNGLPYRPSPFSEPEYTGLAAKSLKEISSDQFDAWYQACDAASDDRFREELRADGHYTEEEIEALVAEGNRRSANNPTIQSDREKMRQLLLEREAKASDKAQRKREDAEYKAKREKENAWRAAEEARLAQMSDEELLGGTPDTPPEQMENTHSTPDAVPFPSPVADDVPTIRPSSENNVASKSIPTDKPFNPDAFALALSKDMSRWNEILQQTYPDVFHLDTSFEQALPEEALQYFHERQQRLQYEYVNRLHNVLQETPNAHRAETRRIVRETLTEKWDSDFADSVIKQLKFTDK